MRFDRRADRVSAFPFFRQVSSIRFLCKSFRADYLSYVCFVICLAEKKEEKERISISFRLHVRQLGHWKFLFVR